VAEALLGVTLVFDLLVETFDLSDWFKLDDIVGVVEVNTLEKFARPFIRFGLLRKGFEPSPKLPSPSPGYRADIGLGYKNGNDDEFRPDALSMFAAAEVFKPVLFLLLEVDVDEV